MRLTKPAGVFFQLVGFLLLLIGLGVLGQSIFWGIVVSLI